MVKDYFIEFILLLVCLKTSTTGKQIVIAHRGASGYLPEHTLPGKAMAVAFGSDYIEQDIVMTKDSVLVVCHDVHLDTTTNVVDVYKGRNRTDGRYYVIDFTWDEIKDLKKTSSFHINSDGKTIPNYPGRFPLWQSTFRMNTLEDEIQMVHGLEKSMGKLVGIYPEIKQPQWHKEQGKNISSQVLEMLKKYNYTTKNNKCYLQCFDADELKQIRHTLMPSLGMDLNLVQLMSYRDSFQPKDMAEIAKYAQGVGPNKNMIIFPNSTSDNLQISDLVKNAHAEGLVVHPWTFRSDQRQVPPYAKDIYDLFKIFFRAAKVDGVLTDFPDKAVRFLSTSSGHRIEAVLCSIFIGISSSLLASFCSGAM